LLIRYADRSSEFTERQIWPLAIMYVSHMLVLLAWCCLREDFQMFRAERIQSVEATSVSFRPRRVVLLRTYLVKLATLERAASKPS
jgi:predicted DNA-binding transcriptional regulator YafY